MASYTTRWLSRKKSSGCRKPLILTSASRSSSRLPMTACSASTLLGGSFSRAAGAIAKVGELCLFRYDDFQLRLEAMADAHRHLKVTQALDRLSQLDVAPIQLDLMVALEGGNHVLGGDRAVQALLRPGFGGDSQCQVGQLFGQLLGISQGAGVALGVGLTLGFQLLELVRGGSQGQPARQQEVASVAIGNVAHFAGLVVLDRLQEYNFHSKYLKRSR